MLNRRYLRIKVMQALYAFYQSEEKDMVKGGKDLFASIDKIYDLYVYLLTLLPALKFTAETIIEEKRNKILRSSVDLHPNLKLVNNPVLAKIEASPVIKKLAHEKHISWQNEKNLIRTVLTEIQKSKEYSMYMNSEEDSFVHHKDFIITIYKYYISSHELLEQFFENKSIHWADDMGLVNSIMLKTILNTVEAGDMQLFPLYKNEEDDRLFAAHLLRETIVHDAENMALIANKTHNWDIDRIAMMDVLLMKMALTEILYFETIPIKVSFNEYIEISKLYSTPRSKMFINGILDKLVQDFRAENKLVKTGRGLVDS